VSAPIDWSELNGSIGSAHFTILNTPARLAALDAIPWTEFYAQAAPLNGSTPRARKRKLT
jgi:bifunctional non-homologous end joining protein LigD